MSDLNLPRGSYTHHTHTHTHTHTGPNVKSIRMVRVLRALRVVSQFKSLRKIVRAITLALWPMMSAMFVCLIVISVFAILGVNAYAEVCVFVKGYGGDSWCRVVDWVGVGLKH
jgi:hypothetical protein